MVSSRPLPFFNIVTMLSLHQIICFCVSLDLANYHYITTPSSQGV